MKLSLASDVSIDTKAQILSGLNQEELLSDIRLVLPSTNGILKLLHFFWRNFSMILNVLKSVGADCIKLLINDCTHLLHVLLAPSDSLGVIVGESLSQNELHLSNHIFRYLALLCSILESFVLRLLPQSNERRQVFLVFRVGQWITE